MAVGFSTDPRSLSIQFEARLEGENWMKMMERGNFQLCLLVMHFCRQQSHHPCRTNISGFAANYCKASTLPVRFQFNILVLVIRAKTSVRTKLSGLETLLTCAVY